MSEKLLAVQRAWKELEEARKRLEEAKQAAIDDLCPVKIGDRVRVNWCSHRGKEIEVRRIVYGEGFDRVGEKSAKTARFTAFGPVLKKDGTPGLNDGEHRGILGVMPEGE